MTTAIGIQELENCRQLVQGVRDNEKHGLPSKTWANMPIKTKTVLIMLGSTSLDDPRQVARKPWESMTRQDRETIGACARQLSRDLQTSNCLF